VRYFVFVAPRAVPLHQQSFLCVLIITAIITRNLLNGLLSLRL